MRDIVTLLASVSDICVQCDDPDKVHLRPELSGTDRGPHVLTDRTGTTMDARR